MSELAAVQAAITSLKSATDIVQILKGSTTSLKDAETKYKLAELLGALADAKTELATVQETIVTKDRQIRDLQDQVALKGSMKFERPYYFSVSGEERDGPFCQRCWDERQLTARLQTNVRGEWLCRLCSNWFHDSTYVPEPPSLPRRNSYWDRD